MTLGMHRRMMIGPLLVLGLLFGARGALGTTDPLRSGTLENKMDWIAYESHRVPLVTLVLACRAGAMTETEDINGLTHLWEHMFFKGNVALPNQEAFKRRVRELGISYNGDTTAETVRYYVTMPSLFLDDGLSFMANAMTSPLLEPSELERERRVVMDEYDRFASQPGFDLYRIRRRALYGDLGFLRDPLGSRKVIETASREQLLRIKGEVFVPGNCVAVVAGDFDGDEVVKKVDQAFGRWAAPAGWKAPQHPPFPPLQKDVEIVMGRENVENARLELTFAGPRARLTPEDTYPVDFLASLLAQGRGKFYQAFIDSGLTFSAGLSYHTQSDAGEIVVYAHTVPEKVREVKKKLLAEIPRWLENDYFALDEFQDVRRNLRVAHVFETSDVSDFAKTLAFWWSVTGIDYYRGYLDALDRVTLGDIQRWVSKYLVKTPHVDTILVAPKDLKKAKLKDNSLQWQKSVGGKP